MNRLRGIVNDDGTAILEFFYLAVLLLVPLVYIMLTVFQVQRAAFGVSAAAREAGRAYVTGSSLDDAHARAGQAAAVSLEDHDLDARYVDVAFPDGGTFGRGDRVTIEVTYQAPLPLLSVLFLGVQPPSIRVVGRHTATVDEFRSADDGR